MNQTKSFTIAAIGIQSVSVGDFNQHFDLLHIPNMGGYKFALNAAMHCNNIIFGVSGIDEIIYGKDILAWKGSWNVVRKEISKETTYWKKYIDKIKHIHVVANSELEEFHKYLNIPYEKMTIIHHGVNHDFFKPSNDKEYTRKKILSKLNIPNSPYFLHIGENNYIRKNQKRIGKAFEQAKKSGLKHNLIIAGKHYPTIEKELSTIEGIFFLDWIPDDDLLSLIQGSDAFIFPSIHEGFGMPLVESMACGIPCISSNRHAPPEVILDSGLLVDPYDIDAIASSMLQLGTNKKLLNDLSTKSLLRSKDFSWEKNAQEILKLYGINITTHMENFEKQYELAAYRTLVSVCDMFPDPKQNLIDSILRFDYYDLLSWAVNYGLKNSKTKDFLFPFADWYYTKFEELSQGI
ncbi:glycosyltransferase [Nitrosopumilus sp. b2]|uniref:glycosyltransferase n=1 Tax=Nitrosopumilus sp. b2 TaxID=2109908 RepID=UPI001C710705|nr:glycosyltransferase [Nitrosopumilus sp. b2]